MIKRHPAVEDCLVFGLSDERFGQRVVGVASLAPGVTATPDEVVDALRDQLSTFKLPRELALVPAVPRAAYGKADDATAEELFAPAGG